MKTQRGNRRIDFSFFNLCARWQWVVNATPQPLYPQEDAVPVVQEFGWAPGHV
jgi:hypothetical protein